MGWSHQDVGNVGFTGDATFDSASATFSVKGAGADVWGAADGFHFVSRPLTGDGYIVARVRSLQNTSASAKAGVMIRETLTRRRAERIHVRHAEQGHRVPAPRRRRALDREPGRRRPSKAPYWVQARTGRQHLQRVSIRGRRVMDAGRQRHDPDGRDRLHRPGDHAATPRWRRRPRSSDYVNGTGLRGTHRHRRRHRRHRRPTPLPTGWSHQDIGAVGSSGAAGYDTGDGTFSVNGAGADVWGTADALHYAYTTLDGDGTIVARVTSVQNMNAWTKAGVMIRDALDPGAAQAFMLVSPAKGWRFQRRRRTAPPARAPAVPPAARPTWVKLERIDATINALRVRRRRDLDAGRQRHVHARWAGSILVGLGVSSHTSSATATATFDNVTVTSTGPSPPPPSTALPDGWSHAGRRRGRRRRQSPAYDTATPTFSVKGAGRGCVGHRRRAALRVSTRQRRRLDCRARHQRAERGVVDESGRDDPRNGRPRFGAGVHAGLVVEGPGVSAPRVGGGATRAPPVRPTPRPTG